MLRSPTFRLFLATAAGAAISFASSPLISRFYEPGAYAQFAYFLSIVNILSVSFGGRLENAVYLPSGNNAALLVTGVGVCLSLACLVLVAAFGALSSCLGSQSSLVAIACFSISLFTLYSNLFNRRKELQTLSWMRFARPALESILIISFSFVARKGASLSWGYLLSYLIPVAIIFPKVGPHLSRLGFARLKIVVARYRKFLMIDLPTALVAAATGNLMVLLLGRYYGDNQAAFAGMATRFASAPLGIVIASYGYVARERMMAAIKADGHCRSVFIRQWGVLTAFAGAYLLCIWVVSRFSSQAFGTQWRDISTTLLLIGILYAVKIVVTPLSYIFYLREKLAQNAAYQFAAFAALALPFVFHSRLEYREMLLAAVLAQIAFYAFYFFHAYRLSSKGVA